MKQLLCIATTVFFVLGCGESNKNKVLKNNPPLKPAVKPVPVTYKDANFYACMKSGTYKDEKGKKHKADANKDGVLTPAEARTIESLDCFDKGIKDLTGIHQLTSLKSLSCSANALEALPKGKDALEFLPNLESIVCENNYLSDADCGTIKALNQKSFKRYEIIRQRDGRKLTCDQVEMVANVPILAAKKRLSDIWGFTHKGEEYIAYGSHTDLHVYKVMNEAPYIEEAFRHPRGVEGAEIDKSPNHSIWSEIRYYEKEGKAYLYMSSEGNRVTTKYKPPQYATLQIVDITNIKAPKEVELKNPHIGLRSIHNITLDASRGLLFAFGGSDHRKKEKNKNGKMRYPAWKGARIYSLEDPTNPQYIRTVGDLYVHDAQVQNKYNEAGELISSRLYAAHGTTAIHWDASKTKNKENRFRVYDITDVNSEPTTLWDVQYPYGYCHNIWATPDGRHVIVTGETSIDNQLSLWELTQDANGQNVAEVRDGLNLQGGSLAHNAFIVGNHIYASHYSKGVQVAELYDTEVAKNGQVVKEKRMRLKWSYDTYPKHNSSEMNGSWGVYPFSPSTDLFFATDRDHGLFVFKKLPSFIREENEGAQP